MRSSGMMATPLVYALVQLHARYIRAVEQDAARVHLAYAYEAFGQFKLPVARHAGNAQDFSWNARSGLCP
jgi:hypothetical protein